MSAVSEPCRRVPLWLVQQFGLIGPAPGVAFHPGTFRTGKARGQLTFLINLTGKLFVDLDRLKEWASRRVNPVSIDWFALERAASLPHDLDMIARELRGRGSTSAGESRAV